LIDIQDLYFGYKREGLFSSLDLKLLPGSIYGLLGKNGAGKTTLLKLISGLRFARAGQCSVFGYVSKERPAGLLEEIYFIPEEFFLPPISQPLYEQLYAPFYPRFNATAFRSYLTEFDLKRGKKLSELSYGQKKKYLLAFGLATGCRLLLLDEPTNGLDIPAKSQFRKLLARAITEEQIILISTHQVRDMENLIDPVIILDEGQIIFQQSMNEVTRRLTVQLEQDRPDDDSVIYLDETLGGYMVVRENRGSGETRIDLETLFNSVIGNREKIETIFSSQPLESEV